MESARRFFTSRRPLKFQRIATGGRRLNFVEYENVPITIGRVVSAGKATLHELDTVYGVTDLYKMLEILAVDEYNQAIINAARDNAQ